MIECRCSGCKRRLFDAEYCSINIICYKCKTFNKFVIDKQTGNDPQTFIEKNEKTVNPVNLPNPGAS